MDFGQIIYIVAVIAYFIYQASRKKKSQDPVDSGDNQPEKPQKGVTFEDLLREIRQAQNPQPKQQEPPKPRPIPTPTFETPREQPSKPSFFPERKSYKPEVVEEVDDEARYYEGAFRNKYQAAETKAAPKVLSIEEMARDIRLKAQNPKRINPYAEKLKNPQSVRDAIILSEILNRKHF
ncbi:hypothetical protein Aoki45_03710 [Algoriphagus sp. oki45]|uniref:hypothetical protein n=1 Tax=Algoriphagus sp. oki45 TaxID=3067294 RepID=UPI0027E7B746|nr:hypothetical protein Aoki45_03710 [Algoriphagus sp. oki45]